MTKSVDPVDCLAEVLFQALERRDMFQLMREEAGKSALLIARRDGHPVLGCGFFAFACLCYFFIYESQGSAEEFYAICAQIVNGAPVPRLVGAGLRHWLSVCTDLPPPFAPPRPRHRRAPRR